MENFVSPVPSTMAAVRAQMRKVRAEQDRLDRYAVPLGNKSSDVLCLGLALSLGDIAAPLAEDGPRRALFRQFHTDFPLDGKEAERPPSWPGWTPG